MQKSVFECELVGDGLEVLTGMLRLALESPKNGQVRFYRCCADSFDVAFGIGEVEAVGTEPAIIVRIALPLPDPPWPTPRAKNFARLFALYKRKFGRAEVTHRSSAAALATAFPRCHNPLMDWRLHLVSDPAICHGKPTIRGTRVLVSVLLSHLAHGATLDEILREFPTVSPEALRAVVAFAAEAAFDDLPAPAPIAASA